MDHEVHNRAFSGEKHPYRGSVLINRSAAKPQPKPEAHRRDAEKIKVKTVTTKATKGTKETLSDSSLRVTSYYQRDLKSCLFAQILHTIFEVMKLTVFFSATP